jgi:lipopolysaccharide transport protein LptA
MAQGGGRAFRMMTHKHKRWWTACLAGTMGVWLVSLPSVRAQVNALSKYIKAEDFKLPISYYEGQYQGQARSIISGREARPLTGAKSYLIKDMKLEMFHETGEREMVVVSPECLYNTETMVASSAARFQLQTTNEGRYATARAEDKGLFLEGEGYEWSHALGRMLVSNKVHTVVHRPLFKDAPGEAKTASGPPAPLEIFSDHTDISITNRTAFYSDNVRVTDPRTQITCGTLLVRGMTGTNGQIESVVAERNVDILYLQDQTRARGEKAVYNALENLVTLTGKPSVDTPQGRMLGETIVLNRTSNELNSKGSVRMSVKPGPANNPSAPKQPLELAADDLKINLTNRHAVYQGNVLAEDDRMRLTSGWLTVDAAEKGGVDRVHAREKVLLINKEDQSRATGEEAVFLAASNLVTLTGNPMLENSQGRMWAQRIELDRNSNQLQARGRVKMEATDLAGKSARPGTTNPPLVLLADAATMNSTNRLAIFTGHVQADDSKMLITSDRLNVQGQPGSNRIDTILAEGSVTMTNRLDKSRATSGKAHYRADIDLLTLTGQPVLENDQGKLAGDTILVDRVRNLLTAKRNVRTEIQPQVTTGLITRTNSKPAAPESMKVYADEVEVNLTNRVAVYTGTIRVESARMLLECERLTVRSVQGVNAAGRTTNGVESIVAEGKVMVLNKEDKTRALGAKAVYLAKTDAIELTGDPVIHKEQGNLVIHVKEKVIWERASNTLHAVGETFATVDPKAYQKNRTRTNAPPARVER